jgi:hypothetical protein
MPHKVKQIQKAQHMFALVKKWEQSGASASSFCHQQSIAPWVFRYWLNRYRALQQPVSVSDGDFEEIIRPPDSKIMSPASFFARIRYADGKELEFGVAVSADYLKSVLTW